MMITKNSSKALHGKTNVKPQRMAVCASVVAAAVSAVLAGCTLAPTYERPAEPVAGQWPSAQPAATAASAASSARSNARWPPSSKSAHPARNSRLFVMSVQSVKQQKYIILYIDELNAICHEGRSVQETGMR